MALSFLGPGEKRDLLMMRPTISPLVACLVLASMIPAQTAEAQEDTKGPAVTPQPRIVEWWFTRHAEKIGEMSKGDIDLLMVGDSITQNFETHGAKAWKKHFEPRKACLLCGRPRCFWTKFPNESSTRPKV